MKKFLFLFLFLISLKVHAIVSQTRYPTTCTNLPIAGGFEPWASPTNAQVEDAIVARTTLGQSSICYCSGYNFIVPSGALIKGIMVEFKRDADPGKSVIDDTIRLYKAGTATGTDKATAIDWTAGTLTWDVYGSSSDLWGVTWQYTDINNSGFGSGIAGQKDAGGSNPFNLDAMRITVFMDSGGGTNIFNGTIYNGTFP